MTSKVNMQEEISKILAICIRMARETNDPDEGMEVHKILVKKLLALIKKHEREVIGEVDATLWLRNVYGLNDDDNLNAGEVEELLKTFMSDLAKLKEVEK